ncbi:hypothetical protein SLA2020_065320 [Shorea laevis]
MLKDFLPCLAMVLVQVGYAIMNITSKLAMESGMKPLVLVAYRQIFSVIAIGPFAFFMERKTRPTITMKIQFQLFLLSITTVTANQVFYVLGLEYSTAIIACAFFFHGKYNLLDRVQRLLLPIIQKQVSY